MSTRALSILIAIAAAVIAAILSQEPASLGLPVVAVNWLGILAAGLAVAASFLPPVQRGGG